MLFADVSVLDENFAVVPHRWVGVRDGRVVYVGTADPRKADPRRADPRAADPREATAPAASRGDGEKATDPYGAPAATSQNDEVQAVEPHDSPADFGEVINGAGRLLMPALYNTHAHSPMVLLRGYAENLPLQRWLNEKCFPFEAKMTGDDCYWGTLLACAEMARFGVVSFTDMYYNAERSAQAVMESGMKASLGSAPVLLGDTPFAERAEYAQTEAMIRQWHGAGNGRIRVDCALHSEYLTTEPVVRDVTAFAKERGLRLHIHLSETAKEVEECRQRHNGLSPVAYFESTGLFEVPVTAAHCVWLDEADLDILQAREVFVANNPASNMKLGSGFAPIGEMFRRGMNVCLGSDGMASNNNHDLFHDMYLQALIYKGATLDPTAVTPQQALRAATRTGALSQGRDDCGLVKEGMRADLCLLDITGPSWCPATDMACNLVYAGHGSDVVMTLCDGRVVYRNGAFPTIDLERAKAECAARTKRILGEL